MALWKAEPTPGAPPPHWATEMPTAGLIIIGNEILSGKIRDENTPYLTEQLFSLGINVREVAVVPDELEVLSATVRRFCGQFTYVFSTGGVGPTHDDITIDAVAHAFGCKTEVPPEMRAHLEEHFKTEHLTPEQLRLGLTPTLGELIYPEGAQYPLIKVQNLYVFPGIPWLLRRKFSQLAPSLQTVPFHREKIRVYRRETEIAKLLATVDTQFPEVRLGSYPILENDQWLVELTLESRDTEELSKALKVLKKALECR